MHFTKSHFLCFNPLHHILTYIIRSDFKISIIHFSYEFMHTAIKLTLILLQKCIFIKQKKNILSLLQLIFIPSSVIKILSCLLACDNLVNEMTVSTHNKTSKIWSQFDYKSAFFCIIF